VKWATSFDERQVPTFCSVKRYLCVYTVGLKGVNGQYTYSLVAFDRPFESPVALQQS